MQRALTAFGRRAGGCGIRCGGRAGETLTRWRSPRNRNCGRDRNEDSLVRAAPSRSGARAGGLAVTTPAKVGLQGALGVVCIVRARGIERVEHGELVVSVDRLAHVLRVAAVMHPPAPSRAEREAARRAAARPGSTLVIDDRHYLPNLQRAQSRRPIERGVPRCPRCKSNLPWVVDAYSATFSAETTASVPVVVDFWAAWCGPCRMISPVLEDLAVKSHAGHLKVVKVDVDANPRLASRFGAQSIPLLVVIRDGARGRPRRRRAASRCAGAAAAASARRLSVDPGSTLREPAVLQAELLGGGSTRSAT